MEKSKKKKKTVIGVLTVYEFVTYYYYELKDIAIRETKKFTEGKQTLNDDIFHTGILRMVEALSDQLITVKQGKGYFCNLYKNALLRNCFYAREKYKHDGEYHEALFSAKEGLIDDSVDLAVMMADIKFSFSDDYLLFVDYSEGYTLKQLDEKYKISNSDYRIRKIKAYIKKNYPELGYGRKKKRKEPK